MATFEKGQWVVFKPVNDILKLCDVSMSLGMTASYKHKITGKTCSGKVMSMATKKGDAYCVSEVMDGGVKILGEFVPEDFIFQVDS
jgi:hypothetical protein